MKNKCLLTLGICVSGGRQVRIQSDKKGYKKIAKSALAQAKAMKILTTFCVDV